MNKNSQILIWIQSAASRQANDGNDGKIRGCPGSVQKKESMSLE
jgi:hypothetical protein